MSIDQDTYTDTGSGTFWTWSISSLTVTINVALDGEFMIAPLFTNDKGTHTSSCVSIADIISYSFETDVLLEYAILMRHVSFHMLVFLYY